MTAETTTGLDQPFSVIIPTLNGAPQLEELLASFRIQTVKPEKILVVDSSSTDDTVLVAKRYGAEVMHIERDAFDHGGTRTRAVHEAGSDYLVFFTQDVIPAHRFVLQNLLDPLLNDQSVGVSYGRQLPSFDANDIARHLRLFNYPETSQTRAFDDRTRYGLSTVFASNSCAAYNRNLLEGVGFFRDGLIFGEDTCAVGRMLQQGLKVAYVADAPVYHSHNYSWSEDFRRYFDIGVLHATEAWLVATYGKAENRGFLYISSGLSYLYSRGNYSLIADFMVRVAMKFMGYQLGRRYSWLPGKIIPELSMHRKWWAKT
ncbi:MAG: glycosyltransferase family A protein [Desulfocapsaceae bacterium]|jgi:rhamnosyltransferase|nr:glycosyltransferase family A protein [Desulfocapsaceae bacterium]